MSEELHFSSYLYAEPAVRKAADAYRELAKIQVDLAGEEIIVTLDGFDGDGVELRDHFANQAIFETVTLARSAKKGNPAA